MSTQKIKALLIVSGVLLSLADSGCYHKNGQITSITISPGKGATPAGRTLQFTAIARYSNGKKKDVTNQVIWVTSNANLAVISSTGFLQTLRAGNTTISATYNGVTGTTTFKVNKPVLDEVEIDPDAPAIANGTMMGLAATGIYSDLSKRDLTTQVTWSSSDLAVATVSNDPGTQGLAAGLAVGTTTVSAAMGNITGSTLLTVTNAVLSSLEVTPTNPSISKLATLQLTATGILTDGTKQDLTAQANWSSSNNAIATVTNVAGDRGVVTGEAVGSATVTATLLGKTGTTSISVTNATLDSIEVTPTAPSLASRQSLRFTAVGIFSDGSNQDISTQVSWASSDELIAEISNDAGSQGVALGLLPGAATISAALAGVTGSTVVTVTTATLASIDVTPAAPSVAKGTDLQFKATGTYSDGSKQDLTEQATWSSSNEGVALVSNGAGSSGLATTLAAGSATVSATFDWIVGSTTFTVTGATLASIQVTPSASSAAKDTTVQFTATGVFSDASTQDLTAQALWQSSNPSLATVSNAVGSEGLATALAAGTTTISAVFSGVTGSTTLTVTGVALASIEVTPADSSIVDGTNQQFTATGVYTDASTQDLTTQVTWASSDAAVATISNAALSEGLASSVDAGTTTISATFSGITGTTTLTVSPATLDEIQVTPTAPSFAKGTQLQFTAMGVFSDSTTQDLTTQVAWGSSDAAIFTVSSAVGSEGLATGLAQGTATITATFSGVIGSTDVTVTPATLDSIQVTPPDPTIAKGKTLQFTATGVYSDTTTADLTTQVTWSSSDNAIATVSNAGGSEGLATAVLEGTVTVSAAFSGKTGSTGFTVTGATLDSIEVTPASQSIAKGTSLQFTATGIFSDTTTQDLTTQVTWASSDDLVATISNAGGSQGFADGIGEGTVTISAAFDGKTGSTDLTVTPAVLLSIDITPPDASFAKGTTLQLTATGNFSDSSTQDLTTLVAWTSSDDLIATVSNAGGSQGLATGVAEGTVTISASFSGETGTTGLTVTPATLDSIEVTPADPSIADGTDLQFTATGTFSDLTVQDLTTQVTWTSSDVAVATVSNALGSEGLAHGEGAGPATISASKDGVTGSTSLTVTGVVLASIEVTPADPTIPNGTTVQFTATGTFSDSSTQDLTALVTWSSSDAAVATVSNAGGSQGLATGEGQGTATIAAALSGKTGSTTITVSGAVLDLIEVTPTAPSIANGTSLQLAATGIFSDGTKQDLTATATWSSSDAAVATVSNVAGSEGLASSSGLGTTTVSASKDGKTGTTDLTVTGATLASIEVTPSFPTIANGTSLQFTAIGHFTDSTVQDLTDQATWTSSDELVALVSNGGGSHGLASALSVGPATISASFSGVTGSTDLTVSGATLDSIELTPPTPSVPLGGKLQFTATGVFSDLTTQDLTTQATWSSSDDLVATVSNVPGSEGLASAVALGTATISAAFGGKTGSTDLTVTGATIESIEVTPADPSIAKLTDLQFTATGVFSDSTSHDVTTLVTWSSSAPSIAAVSNAAGSEGLASALTAGTTTVAAALDGKSGSTVLTVTNATLDSIQITPADPAIVKGTTQQFTATGNFSDATTQDLTAQVTWSTSSAAVATISNAAGSRGLATGQAQGSATISAAFLGQTGSTSLSVTDEVLNSIEVTPTAPSIAKGTKVQFTATGIYAGGSNQDLTTLVTWSSSDAAVATVSNTAGSQGQASGVDAGPATITASFAGKSGSTVLTVTPATLDSIEVTPALPTIADGTTLQLTATGVYSDATTQDLTTQVTWDSSDGAVATVSNAAGSQGLATALSGGTTTVSASFSGVTGSTDLTVTPATLDAIEVTPTEPSMAKGTSLQFTAMGIFSDSTKQDLTTQVTWTSSAESFFTVSNSAGSQGLASALAEGTGTISATFSGVTGSTDVTVTPATLDSIEVAPLDPSIAQGKTVQFTATGVYSDSTVGDLTTQVTWASSDNALATVSNAAGSEGLATALAQGSVTISAAFGGKTGSTGLTVTGATLDSIEVSPADQSIAKGTNLQFTATGVFSDLTTQDLTTQVTWASSDDLVATVSNAGGSQGFANGATEGTVTISAALDGKTGSTGLTVTAPTLDSIEVTPADPSIANGTELQFTATGTFSDSTTQDLTIQVVWFTSDAAVATVGNPPLKEGLATALSAGTTTISAVLGGTSGSTVLTVTPATLDSIEVTPADPSIADGTDLQFTATGTFSDLTVQDLTTQVAWTSSDEAVATVSNAAGTEGLATGESAGLATISAAKDGVTGSTSLTVTGAVLASIEVTPADQTVALGTSGQFTATGVFTDASTQDLTDQVTWLSADAAVVSISNAPGSQGFGTAEGVGSTTISASFSGVTGSTSITVSGAVLDLIEVTPTAPSIANGTGIQLAATGIFSDGTKQDLTTSVTWSSSDAAVAVVSNLPGSEGFASALSVGAATLSVSLDGKTGSTDLAVTAATLASIEVSPSFPTIANGTSVQFTAIGLFSDSTAQDLTDQAAWSSSDDLIATVSNAAGSRGLSTAASAGSVTISASFSGVTGSTDLTVTGATLDSIEVTPTTPSIALGTTVQFTATGVFSDLTTQDLTTQVTWASADAAIAAVSNAAGSQGLASGLATGTVTISAALGGTTGSTDLTVTGATLDLLQVTPADPSVAKGTSLQFTATGTFSDASTQDLTALVTWSSSTPSFATVSNAAGSEGRATALAEGTTTVAAAFGGKSGSTALEVTGATLDSIEVAPADPGIIKGTTVQFTATGIFSDSTVQDLTAQATWLSSDAAVATVSNASGLKGLASGLAQGSVTISAAFLGKIGSTSLSVTDAVLNSIEVTPTAPSIANGTTVQLAATGIFADGSKQDLTTLVTWSSSDSAVAALSNNPGTQGLATGLSAGATTVTAAFAGKTGSTSLTVTGATITSLEVTPADQLIANGTTLQFAATGVFSDNTTQDLTADATWSSSDDLIATISNGTGTAGQATSASVGSVTISAAFGGQNASTNLTVTAATLIAVDVSPAAPSIANGTTFQFTATGVFSDLTVQDVTDQAIWSSDDNAVATVSNAPGSQGLATAHSGGTAAISAVFGGQSDSEDLTVTAATLVAISVDPSDSSIPQGIGVQFTATGFFTDATSQDITTRVTWFSSDAAVAAVSNAAGSEGQATTLAAGVTTVSAQFGGQTGSTDLTVTGATLDSIEVEPADQTINKGETVQYTATGTFSDSTVLDLTTQVTWLSSDAAVASVSNAAGSRGLGTGTGGGTAAIQAVLSGKTGSTNLTVIEVTLDLIDVTPAVPAIANGTAIQFAATGIFSNGTKQDLTATATWSSSNGAVASVSNVAGSQGLAAGLGLGTSAISAAFGGKTGSTDLTVSAATLDVVRIAPTNPSIAAGTSLELAALGIFSDGTNQDLTTQVTWSSSDDLIATVSNAAGSQGLAAGVATGTATISAAFGGKTGTTDLTITAATLASIEVSPAAPSIADGTTFQFAATGVFSDLTTQDLTEQVSWSSSAASTATISNDPGSQGLATALAVGGATISAAFGGVTGSTDLTVTGPTLVSIDVSPAAPSLAKGLARQFAATGAFSDGTKQDLTTQAIWASSDRTVAVISNAAGSEGLATALVAGNATVSATFDGVTGSTELTVTNATLDLVLIEVTPAAPTIAKGRTLQFNVTGVFSDGTPQDLTPQVTWFSSDEAVATISNAAGSEGLATGVAAGTTTISATFAGVTGSAPLTVSDATLDLIEVSPAAPSISSGTEVQFAASGVFSDGTKMDLTDQVTWSSSAPSIAVVSNAAGSKGLATTLAAGGTTISATASGVTGSTSLTVTGSTLVSIEITPPFPSVADGMVVQFTATGVFSDSTTQDLTSHVTWFTSDDSVATVSNAAGSEGLATALAAGTTSISVIFEGLFASTDLTVTAAGLVSIEVDPTNASISGGTVLQYTAIGVFTDSTLQDLTDQVTWTTSDASIAVVSNAVGTKGLASGLAAGSVTVSAALLGKTGSTDLTVTGATLDSIEVTPADASISSGTSLQFTATGVYSDATTRDITTLVSWVSSNGAVATVSNAADSEGLATSLGAGNTTISATLDGVTGSTPLSVTNSTLDQIQITPADPSVAKGAAIQFTATGVFSDTTTQDLTSQVAWFTTDPAIAVISNAGGSKGLATSIGSGTATIVAILSGKTGSTSITVTSLERIEVTPVAPSIANGTKLQFVATGILDDNTKQDLTALVTWSSSANAVATISNDAGTQGLASAASVGSTVISASFGGKSGSSDLTVTPATLDSIEVTPVAPTLPEGASIHLVAMGIFSDGTKQDLTDQVTWESSDDLIATVSNDAGNRGFATAVSAGSAVLSAIFGGKTGTTDLEVVNLDLAAIEVTPTAPTIGAGTTLQLVATAILSDNSRLEINELVTWDSTDYTIASVSNAAGSQGLIAGVAPGVATITATVGGVTGSTAVTVTDATLLSIDVTPTATSLPVGFGLEFMATGTFSDGTHQDLTAQAVWTSSDSAVAAISNAAGSEGLAKALATGSVTVTAALFTVSGSTSLTVTDATLDSIQVTPVTSAVAVGTTFGFEATGVFSDGTTLDLTHQVTWSSSNAGVAAVSNAPASEGLATALSAGSATISAGLAGVSGSTLLTVGTPTLDSIQVVPVDSSQADGTTFQFAAIGSFSDGTTQDLTGQATWASSDPAVATVSNAAGSEGLATALGAGTTTVSATLIGVTGSTSFTITTATLDSIEVTPVSPSLAEGTSLQFTATGVFSNGTTQDLTAQVTWESSDLTVATISSAAGSDGLATALAVGLSTVSATLSGVTGSTSLTVTDATLDRIEITPPVPSIAKGTNLQFTATAVFSDGSTQDLTAAVSWDSSDPLIASISNAAGSEGLASGLAAGTATISATFGVITASEDLTVTAATLAAIEVSPTAPSLADGTTLQFVATGILSDSSKQDLTALVTWSSSNGAVAAVSNASGTKGLASGVGAGSTTVSATFSGQTGSTLLTVTPATLDAIEVTPSTSTITIGSTLQFTATGVFSDASTQDLTTQVTWSSSASFVASVSNADGSRGLATGASTGSVTISASLGGKTGSTALEVSGATLDSLEVTPVNPIIAAGTTLQFVATGTFSDGLVQDLTAQVTWSTVDPFIATVSNAAGFHGLSNAVAEGITTISASLGGMSASTTLAVSAATLDSIAVTPVDPSIAAGTTLQFTATGTFSDSSTQDVTTLVTWFSSDLSVATVGNPPGVEGLANAQNAGSTTVSAVLAGKTGSTTLTVTGATLVSIAVTPADVTIPKGTTLPMVATGTFSDASTQDLTAQVTWFTSDAAVAAVSNAAGSKGLATGIDNGTTTILATFSGQTGSTTLSVTDATLEMIEVSPALPAIADGTQIGFTAMGIFSDATKQNFTALVAWSSSDNAVATVSNLGLASAIDPGTAAISATFGGVTGSTDLTVTAATLDLIEVTPTAPSIADGTNVQLAATGIFSDGTNQDLTAQATWSSSNAPIATVSNAAGSQGLATGVSPGSSTVSAAFGGKTGSTDVAVTNATLDAIEVTPTAPIVADGVSVQLAATGIFSDGTNQDLTTQVVWSSSDALIATVSNNPGTRGLARGESPGSATVSAALAGVTGSTVVEVTTATLAALDVFPSAATIIKGSHLQYTATGTFTDGTKQDLTTQVSWVSSDPSVALLSNAPGSEGLATGVGAGSATIFSAKLGGVTGSTSLTVTEPTLLVIQVVPGSHSIADGTTLQFTATGTYSDGSTQDLTDSVTWSSSDTAVATVSNAAGSEGLATALDPGSTTVSALLSGLTGSTTLTVTIATLDSVEVTPTASFAASGTTVQFTATGVFSDGSTQDLTDQVTWFTSAPAVATVSNAAGSQGLATAGNVGSATILATFSAISGSTTLTVTNATLDSIEVTPTEPSIAKGTTFQFTATGIFSDGSNQDLTDQVTWLTSDPTLATVSNAGGSEGLAKGLDLGTATITATLAGVSGTTDLTVTPAVLQSIQLSPLVLSIAEGTTVQYTATGVFTDATTQDLTEQATWSSSSPTIASVSNAAGTKGVVTGVSGGTATIIASFGGLTGSRSLTVNGVTLVSIDVSPAFPSTAKGTHVQFTAIGIFSDGSNQDLTDQVTWVTFDATVAAVSNAAGTEGLATGLDVGTATIAATSGGISGSTDLSVSAATLDSIDVTPSQPIVAAGTKFQFTATGIYSDATVEDLTTQVTWFTSDGAVATISNAAGSKGLASAKALGSAAILAMFSGKTGSTTIAVTNAVLNSIEITPADPAVPKGTTFQLTATGVYTDGTALDLTSQVTWESSDDLIAGVSNASGTKGLAIGSNIGSATISAMFGGLTGSTTVTVTAAILSSIEIEPLDDSIANGTTLQFVATGIYSDLTEQDISSLVTWTSSDTAVAVISNASGAHGLARGVTVGTVNITAAFSGITATTTLTVTNATLTSIVLSPTDGTIPKGTHQQFSATGLFSDDSAQDLTKQVTWFTSDGAVASISNAIATKGLATGTGQGTATILAVYAGLNASTTISVNAAQFVSITISPANGNLPRLWKRNFTAIATYSDSSTADITTQVAWASSNTAVATISNASGFQGQASGLVVGATTISATFQGSSAYANLNVTNETIKTTNVSPNATLFVGQTLQMTATATFSGGTVLDITKQVVWKSNHTNNVSVSNTSPTNGLARALKRGSANITVQRAGKVTQAKITVL